MFLDDFEGNVIAARRLGMHGILVGRDPQSALDDLTVLLEDMFMTIELDLTGKVVLVTGGTKGVGRGIATRFADAGATIAVCARNPVDDLPADWTFLAADIRDGEAAFALIDAVVEQLGSIDVLVNNAGGGPPADTTTASPRFTERIVALEPPRRRSSARNAPTTGCSRATAARSSTSAASAACDRHPPRPRTEPRRPVS